MIPLPSKGSTRPAESSELARFLLEIPASRRTAVLLSAASFHPDEDVEQSFQTGPIRAAFADDWEEDCCGPVPLLPLRALLDPPISMATLLEIMRVRVLHSAVELEEALCLLVEFLSERLATVDGPRMRSSTIYADAPWPHENETSSRL